MSRAVIAIADQVMVQELRSRLDQSETEIEVVFVAESTSELTAAVLGHRPAVLFVHDQLGPGSVSHTVRDLTLRNPALAVVVVTSASDAESYRTALDAGARAVINYPFSLEEVDQRLAVVTEWAQSVRTAFTSRLGSDDVDGSRGGRMIAVAGAKGGLGTTIVSTHLAWDIAISEPEMRICLVDLDVEKGDVPSYLDVSHRVSIADLAKISEDLTTRAVADTVVVHSSGLHLLLAPVEIRDTEAVTPEAIRRVLAQLRNLYHLVVIDTGSAVTTTQAAAVESADLVLQVVTADVPALRAARRQVLAWESLSVSPGDSVRVLVNRFQRNSEIQNDTIDRLVLGTRVEVLMPELGRALERSGNSRTPSEVKQQTWWRTLRALGAELDVTRQFREAQRQARGAEDGAPRRSLESPDKAEPGRKRRRTDSGQVTLENVAMIPLALTLLVVCLQAALVAVAFVWSGLAAESAARAVALGEDPYAAAEQRVPPGFAADLRVNQSGTQVDVRLSSPLLFGNGVRSAAVVVGRQITGEPR